MVPKEHRIDAVWVRLAAKIVERSGTPAESYLTDAGINTEILQNFDAKISLKKHIGALRLAAEKTGDEFFGLHFGEKTDLQEAGALGFVMYHSPSLGVAIDNLCRYLNVLGEGREFKAVREGGELSISFLRAGSAPDVPREGAELGFSILLSFFRVAGKSNLNPIAVHFKHREPKNNSVYREFFRAPLNFSAEQNMIVFDVSIENHPVKGADKRLYRVLETHIKDLIGQQSYHDDFLRRLESTLIEAMESGQPYINSVAQEFGMSARSMQRRLRERDIDFKSYLANLRHRLANRYLDDQALSVSQVAYVLGYSELAAFDRAYKRWSGITPRQRRHG